MLPDRGKDAKKRGVKQEAPFFYSLFPNPFKIQIKK